MRDPQYMKGIHARIIEKMKSAGNAAVADQHSKEKPWGISGLEPRGCLNAGAVAGAGFGAFEARSLLKLIDSAGWARRRLFITAQHQLSQTSQVELLYGCLENRGSSFSLGSLISSHKFSNTVITFDSLIITANLLLWSTGILLNLSMHICIFIR